MTVRVAVVGCGYWARHHCAAWGALGPDAALVAVCDTDAGKAARAARAAGAQAFTDAATMLDAARPDLVDIVTRMDTHRALAALCAARGIAAVVQKPLAPDWDAAKAIVAEAARAGTFLAVHENFRFQPAMQRIAQVLRSGEIGAPSWARIAFRTGADVYADQPYFRTEARLVILDLGIHLLDLARVFLGEVAHLSCETQRRNPDVHAEDTATMLLRHVSGAVSVVECTYESRRLPQALSETFVEIEGPRGAVVLGRDLTLSVTAEGLTRTESLRPAGMEAADAGAGIAASSVRATCAHILEAFRAGRQADVSGADNLATFALAEAAYRAAQSGRAERPEMAGAP